jgi:hypothetical protein
MTQKYQIIRPPLARNFELPTREELLALEVGDHAKVTFQVGEDMPERMWVVLTDCSIPEEWSGTIDNDATQEHTAKVLPADKEVHFHPLDIIAVM